MEAATDQLDTHFLHLEVLPIHSRRSIRALKAHRGKAGWEISGVRLRWNDSRFEEAGTWDIDLNTTLDAVLASVTPLVDDGTPGVNYDSGCDTDTWLRHLGFPHFTDFEEISRCVPLSFLAVFGDRMSRSASSENVPSATEWRSTLWSRHPDWNGLNERCGSRTAVIETVQNVLDVPRRLAGRLALCATSARLGAAPRREDARLLALALHLVRLDRRLANGVDLSATASRLHDEWVACGCEPLVLWLRALQVRNVRRWSALTEPFPLSLEELTEWFRSLLAVAARHVPTPTACHALVAGWISTCDPDAIASRLLEIEANPFPDTEHYRAASPVEAPIHLGNIVANPIVTAQAMYSHPALGQFLSPDMQVRDLLEGTAWYFALSMDQGESVLARIDAGPTDLAEKALIVARDGLIHDHAPWQGVLDALLPLLRMRPERCGDSAYRARLRIDPPMVWPREGDLDIQLAWAQRQAEILRAHEFMEVAAKATHAGTI